jgi:hypothetical protein
MKTIKILSIIFGLALLFESCLKDDHFGKSRYNTLTNLVLDGQLGNASVNQETGVVICSMDSTADVTQLEVIDYGISNYASITPGIGEVLDFTDSVDVVVTAENGTPRTYKVVVEGAKQNEQLPNSGFQNWYDTGNGYLEIGTGPNNIIWNSGNAGAVIAGNIPTYPDVIGDNDSIAVMETFAVVFGPRIAAGSLFTGMFELDIINPPNSIKPGIPFTSKPTAFKLKMKFQPGLENKDGNGNPLTYDDEADIYVLLEVRSGDDIKRLATGWYRSSEAFTDWHELEVDLTYGPLDSSFPDFMKPADGKYAEATETPTHISVIMSSSAGGGEFAGAVGSKLQVNDFELVY